MFCRSNAHATASFKNLSSKISLILWRFFVDFIKGIESLFESFAQLVGNHMILIPRALFIIYRLEPFRILSSKPLSQGLVTAHVDSFGICPLVTPAATN